MSEYAHHESQAPAYNFHPNPITGELFTADSVERPDENNTQLAPAVLYEIQAAAEVEDHLRDLGMSQARIDKEVGLGRRMLKLVRGGHDVSCVLPPASSSNNDVISDDLTPSKENPPIVQKREYRDIASAAANDHD